jgi:hypothetical protein
MKRILISASIVTALLFGSAAGASAERHGGKAKTSGNKLMLAWNEALLSASESNPWVAENGCTGGTGEKDPGFIVMPFTNPPSAESSCTFHEDAPLVFVVGGVTCWQPTLAAAKDECEAGWTDPGLVLVSSSIEIDGKPQKQKVYRTSTTSFTFPEGALFDAPGSTFAMYAISQGVIRELDEGTHTVHLQVLYADGFGGETTFTINVVH